MPTMSMRSMVRRNGRPRRSGGSCRSREIDAAAERLIAEIPALSDADRRDELVVLRRDYLKRQLEALRTRVRMLAGREADLRRGVAGALRRGRAGASGVVLRGDAEGARSAAAGRRAAGRSLRRVPAEVHHPVRSARRASSIARSPNAGRARCRTSQLPAERELHGRVRHEQAVERLQLVSGQLPQPDPGEHRSADLHRSRDRSRVPRRLSRAPRLQRAARKAPGARSRLDRVHRSTRCSRRSR